ncbi:MAG TPA: hypothetical protein VFN10_15295 [Thermoanaerobaculia bacterium]|nr:hypothetical protein [Thermoanaerobaculia bacterium]
MRFFIVACITVVFLLVWPLRADGPLCTRTTNELPLADNLALSGIGGSFTYDDITGDMLAASGVTSTRSCIVAGETVECLFVPKYTSSDSCSTYHLDKCFDASHPAGPNDFCVVTDELSQFGLLLALSKTQAAVDAFAHWTNTVKALSSYDASGKLPVWNVRVRVAANGSASIEPWNDDDASDATARIILALYVAAARPEFASARDTYEDLANRLANRFAHADVRDTRNRYGAGRFWLASGRNAAANAVTNNNPFTFAGYYGDAALAMLAAYRVTGESRYADLASDIIENYLGAAAFTSSFAVPPIKFSWNIASVPAAAVAREDLSGHWDDADAPRAVSICKAAYEADRANVPLSSGTMTRLADYCLAWTTSDGVLNGDAPYQRQYSLNGSAFGARSLHYWNTGLGAALNFLLCPDDLTRRLNAAAAQYDVSANVFRRGDGSNEACLGVYTHAFFMTNFGSAIGRDDAAFHATVPAPTNVTVTPSGETYNVSWTGTAVATYEIARGCNAETFAIVRQNEPATSWTDDAESVPGASFLYKVRAVVAGERSPFSAIKPVPDTPVTAAVPRVTTIHADDVAQIQRGVNRIRAAASLSPLTFTTITPGVTAVSASDFASLQTQVNNARAAVGRDAYGFTPVAQNGVISAKNIDELRNAVRACPDANLVHASE